MFIFEKNPKNLQKPFEYSPTDGTISNFYADSLNFFLFGYFLFQHDNLVIIYQTINNLLQYSLSMGSTVFSEFPAALDSKLPYIEDPLTQLACWKDVTHNFNCYHDFLY